MLEDFKVRSKGGVWRGIYGSFFVLVILVLTSLYMVFLLLVRKLM